jgi:hypothetical protein
VIGTDPKIEQALQSAVSRLEGHIKSLEEAIPKKK